MSFKSLLIYSFPKRVGQLLKSFVKGKMGDVRVWSVQEEWLGVCRLQQLSLLSRVTVTKLKGFICLHASKPSKTQTGVCSKESKGNGIKPRDTSVLTFKDLAPQWFLGDRLPRGKIISHGRLRELGHGLY